MTKFVTGCACLCGLSCLLLCGLVVGMLASNREERERA